MTVTEVYQCFIDQLQNSTVHSISLYEELTILYQKMKEVAVLTSDDDLSLKLDNAHAIIQEANSILEKTYRKGPNHLYHHAFYYNFYSIEQAILCLETTDQNVFQKAFIIARIFAVGCRLENAISLSESNRYLYLSSLEYLAYGKHLLHVSKEDYDWWIPILLSKRIRDPNYDLDYYHDDRKIEHLYHFFKRKFALSDPSMRGLFSFCNIQLFDPEFIDMEMLNQFYQELPYSGNYFYS